MRAPDASRRAFLTGATSLAAGLALSGCGGFAPAASHPDIAQRRPASAAARRGDVGILSEALAMERHAVAAYAACIPLLSRGDAPWAEAFVGEELQQTGALAKLIVLCGRTAPKARAIPAIGDPRDGAQALALLESLEDEHVRRYLGWIPQLSAGTMRAGVATLLAADAQHLGALRRARGLAALTSPFVLDGAA